MPSKPVVLDTNLLLLLSVGETDRSLIGKHKRLQAYEQVDFDDLLDIVSRSGGLLLCPNVVSETSNFVRHIHQQAAIQISHTLKVIVERFSERFIESRQAVANAAYLRLGVTDAVLLTLASTDAVLVTDDLDLAVAADRSGADVINYSHVRQARYERY
jgi:hypothetical protein